MMRRRTLRLILLGAALLATPGVGGTPVPGRGAAAAATAPAPGPASARWLTLKNGARLLLIPDPRAGAVSVAVWVESGVRYERPGINGISHLVEHLSARGVAPGGESELRRRIEAVGGTTASFTTADFTCFAHAVPRASLELLFQLEAGRFAARPTQAMLDHQRSVVREEIRARAQVDPLDRPLQRLYAIAFAGHPYRWPVLGTDEDLAKITLKDCEEFLRTRYAPDQTVITVVGDFDPEQALGFARRYIEPIALRGGRPAPSARALAERPGERRGNASGDLPVPMLVVGWRAPLGADDDAAYSLMTALLTGGQGGRLSRRLIADEKTCLFARTGRDRQRDGTMFWAAAAIRPGADTLAVERSLVGEIERLASEPIGGEELDRTRRQLEVALLLGRQTAGDRGQAAGTAQMVAGDWQDADRQLQRLRALTPADVQQAAARALGASRRTVVWLSATPDAAGAGGGR